jgi:serine/threonine protein kinase
MTPPAPGGNAAPSPKLVGLWRRSAANRRVPVPPDTLPDTLRRDDELIRDDAMPGRPSDHRPVRLGGRTFPVIGEERIRGRTYLLLESLGAAERPRFRAFDPWAGWRGEPRRLTILPKTPDSEQHLRTLFRVRRTNDAFSIVLDWEERRDSFALVSEWVGGIDLKSYLGRPRHSGGLPISPHQAIRLIKGLAHGLGWLHKSAGIIHADIKPANLIVNRNARRLVLVDFGSAWPIERTVHRAIGDGPTASYSAPELQGATGVIDGRADQFSASVVFYEMLTGQLPYQWGGKAGRPEYAVTMQTTFQPPSLLSPYREHLPTNVWQAIDRVVTTGVAFDPVKRFPNTAEWLSALEIAWRQIDPLPALATPSTGVWQRLRSLFRRR